MNKVFQSMRIAFRALRVNKLRSMLTMLGIIIGVGAVIAMVSIGSGAANRIKEQIASIGSNVIQIQGGSQNQGNVKTGNGNQPTLTEDDAIAMTQELPSVAYASPSQGGRQQVIFQSNNWQSQVQGVFPDFLAIRDIKIESGETFTMDQVRSAAKVCLLGKTVVDNLFAGADPIGQTIRIRKIPFTVIGTLVPKGQSAQGQDQDDTIIMPISTAKKKVIGGRQNNAGSVGNIMVQARDGRTQQALTEITELLRQRHKLGPNEDNDFQARSLEEIAAAAQESANTTGFLLAAIASVSLVVGGIGIMNIMLVSVTERTKEIGLRQAVGAKTNDILGQFLVEAVTVSLLGGLIGIVTGVLASIALARVGGFPTLVDVNSIVYSVVFSALVGIVFGYYPARKAAMLDPIEALRYE
ncbi:MAG: ABC transporter permease [Bryobacteraceae bacterium]